MLRPDIDKAVMISGTDILIRPPGTAVTQDKELQAALGAVRVKWLNELIQAIDRFVDYDNIVATWIRRGTILSVIDWKQRERVEAFILGWLVGKAS
jgi:hypothetical protein